jgi:hypothetical protein
MGIEIATLHPILREKEVPFELELIKKTFLHLMRKAS